MRPTFAEIDLAAIGHNLGLARSLAPTSKLMLAIKADAYGHGAVEVAKASQHLVEGFAVAILEEAIELRQAGIRAPILVLQGILDEAQIAVFEQLRLWPVVHHGWQVDLLILQYRPVRLDRVWIKVDVGMHRLGLTPAQAEGAMTALLGRSSGQRGVLMAHLPNADEQAQAPTLRQIGDFLAIPRPAGWSVSISNSAAIDRYPLARQDWNRVGYLAYGGAAHPHLSSLPEPLQPAMHLRTEIIAVREVGAGEAVGYGSRWRARRPSRIATLPIGYADGYPRHLPDGAPVAIGGGLAAIAGRVSMDLTTIDITDLPASVDVGSPVELWGESVSVDQLAELADTIGYELMSRVSPRVRRRYRSAAARIDARAVSYVHGKPN